MVRGTRLTTYDRVTGNIPLVTAGEDNSGVSEYIGNIEQEKFYDTITIDMFGNCFYHRGVFCADDNILVLKNDDISMYAKLFISSVVNQDKYRYSYGRQYRQKNYIEHYIKLPIQYNPDGSPLIDNTFKYSDNGYVPDWQFMEDYIKSLHYKPLTTKRVSSNNMELNVSQWEEFYVGDVFKIKYGINMELNACEECDMNDSESVAFVARTAENNGVSAYVKKEKDKVPQKAGTITCAGGGSVLSTFVQFHNFYSGRDLYLLNEKEALSIKTKLFLTTIILKNQYKYSYGRQANKTLPSLVLKLPIQRNADGSPVIDKEKKYHSNGYIPDWQFMENYIDSLPYSDRIM